MGRLLSEGIRDTERKHFVLARKVSAICSMTQAPAEAVNRGTGMSKVRTGAEVQESTRSLCGQTRPRRGGVGAW